MEIFRDRPVSISALRRLKASEEDCNRIIKQFKVSSKIRIRTKEDESRVIQAYIKYCNYRYNNEWAYPTTVSINNFIEWIFNDKR